MASYGAKPTDQSPASAINTPIIRDSSRTSTDSVGFFNRQPAPAQLNVPQKDLLVFFRQLSVILQSGVAIAQGMVLIAENMTNRRLAHAVQNIAGRLTAGEELSTTLKQYPKVFKPIAIGLIEAGEAGGILESVLDRIALLMEEQAKIRGQLIGAMVYPVIVLVLAVSVSLGLLIFIVPRFQVMFESMGAELPALTSTMLTLSKIVTSPYFALGGPTGILLFVLLFNQYYGTASGRMTVDSNILKLPLFGSLLLRTEMAGLCDTLATLVNSGIPIVEALERCESASSNALIKQTIRQGINRVMQGEELNYGLGRSGVLPKLVISMIKIGEETGQLSFMLEKLAVFYKREVDSAVSSLTKAMEPTVVFVVAGIVGTIVIALYLPMFSMISNMRG